MYMCIYIYIYTCIHIYPPAPSGATRLRGKGRVVQSICQYCHKSYQYCQYCPRSPGNVHSMLFYSLSAICDCLLVHP